MKLETHNRKIYNRPDDALSEETIIQIMNRVASKYRVYLPSLDNCEFWQWKSKDGNLIKKIAKHVYKTNSVKMDSDFLGEIGSIASGDIVSTREVEYDYDMDFDWRAGDFGDSGSCFWGENCDAKDMMRENGFYAFRIWQDGYGKARAWIYPDKEHNVWIMFNGYGYSTLCMARMFAEINGFTYRRICLQNNSTAGGTLYINSGRGYVIGDIDDVEAFPETYDFYIPEYDDYGCTCSNCGESVYEDELTYFDGGDLCNYCLEHSTTTCQCCGDRYWNSREGRDFESTIDGYVCTSCIEEMYVACYKCDELVRETSIAGDYVGSNKVCNDCVRTYHLEKCEQCEQYSSNLDDNNICEICGG